MSGVAALGLAAGMALTLGAPSALAEEGAMIVPASGKVTGTPNGYCTSGNSHDGFDIAASVGTPVVASADGTVRQADYADSPGNRIVLDHASGWETRYLHLDSKAVSTGESVTKGQVIGTVGNTGSSTGPHLHFQIERNDSVIRDGSLLDDFTCHSTVSQGSAIGYSFPGLPGGGDVVNDFPKLREGDRGEKVELAQTLLTQAGYDTEVDGVFGEATVASLKAFQEEVGAEVDAVLGPKSWGALLTAPAAGDKLREGSSGEEVKYLQRGLNATLRIDLGIDGKLGSATLSAVKQYQESRGLAADGVVGPDTWSALKSGA